MREWLATRKSMKNEIFFEGGVEKFHSSFIHEIFFEPPGPW